MKLLLEAGHTLEFEKILAHISQKCVSELGRQRLLNSHAFDSGELLKSALSEVTEATLLFTAEGGLPLWTFDDIRPLLKKIEPLDSYLEIMEFQKVQNFLEVSSAIRSFFDKREQSAERLCRYAARIDPMPNLQKLLESTIDPHGTVYDNASPDLKNIRTKISSVSQQIHTKLDRIIRRQKEHLQNELITLRDGRLVIPVREFSVNKIPGIVHGQSATGQTHFVEPLSVVALNNEIFELYNQEKREIIRILRRLSSQLREKTDMLIINQDNLLHIDAVQAKAKYAIEVKGQAPIVSETFTWKIKQGYHPLLLRRNRQDTVPLTLAIGDDPRMIVITGPNAGGKTVALKTVGLLQLLFQCGFHIPVAEGSSFPVCSQLAAVIGDEQSIENDLSTFSSHIKKLNTIINAPLRRSLILIDEIGTGTDPAEGSAMAIAMLEKLNQEGLATIVTTHLGELKAFAHREPGVANAAMQFDFENLSPLFILEVGVPGSSYAFEISKRLGVAEPLLDRARALLGQSHDELENMITDLTVKRQDYDKKINELSIKETELEGFKALYRSRAEDLKRKRRQYESESLAEAKDILENVNRTIENVIRDIRESNAKPEIIKNGRAKILKLHQDLEKKLPKKEVPALSAQDLKLGQLVRSRRFSVSGQISKLMSDKKQLEIDTNGVKITIPFSDVLLPEQQDEETKIPAAAGFDHPSSVANELDLRGKLAEEALVELEQYLDIALNSAWQEVRIIHGKGTGALRSKIHGYLKKNKKIKSYRLGGYGEGDTGVTVIEI
jgi:DNA mismatch repair protein MutS2